MTFKIFDVVTSNFDVPEAEVQAGQIGAIVEIFHNPDGYGVEFCDEDGQTLAMLGMDAKQISLAKI